MISGRYVLATGEYEELYEDVREHSFIGDGVYVITNDGELYRVTAKGEDRLAEDVYDITETYDHGFYVTKTADAYDIEYFAPGSDKGERVAYDVDNIVGLNYYVEYYNDEMAVADAEGTDNDIGD